MVSSSLSTTQFPNFLPTEEKEDEEEGLLERGTGV